MCPACFSQMLTVMIQHPCLSDVIQMKQLFLIVFLEIKKLTVQQQTFGIVLLLFILFKYC